MNKVTTVAQNLPYGTHIFKMSVEGNPGLVHMHGREFTFHQPKMPPIPEDAVVIADYMLMADFVKSTNTTEKIDDLSKGIRLQAASRDIFYDRTGGYWDGMNHGSYVSDFITPIVVAGGDATSITAKLPYFGFTKGALFARRATDACDLAVTATNSSGVLESTNVTVSTRVIPALSGNTADLTHSGNVYGAFNWEKSDGVLGVNTVSFDDANLTSTYDWLYMSAMEIASPIHTSSHYQSFETPFLHELVGGDRNMEQTNLVVTPDGKTWDEVTRKTDYLGFSVYANINAGNSGSSSGKVIFANQRGGPSTSFYQDKAMKGVAYGYDRIIILEDGLYTINYGTYSNSDNVDFWLKINNASTDGTNAMFNNRIDVNDDSKSNTHIRHLKRGDYLMFVSNANISKTHTHISIIKN